MEKSTESTDEHIPSFFQNSSQGSGATAGQIREVVEETDDNNAARPNVFMANKDRGKAVVGGFTCSVPECFSNSKRNPELSFYNFPNGKSAEKQELRKKWLHMISRKDFKDPKLGHRVCSLHFLGGRKTYLNNIPTIVPKTKINKEQKERKTYKARNREFVPELVQSTEPINHNVTSDQVEIQGVIEPEQQKESEEKTLKARILELERANVSLTEKVDRLTEGNTPINSKPKSRFLLDDIKSNPKSFRFYTGLTDYETFKIIFDSFGPAAGILVYHGTKANPENIDTPEYNKRGPKRALTAEQEFFYVLVKLRLGLLEEDIAFRVGISCSHFSRICITWLDFLHSKFRTYPIWPSK